MHENESAHSQETSLNLLAADAILRVTFAATLTPEQYSELLTIATQVSLNTEALSAELTGLGQRWGITTAVRRVRIV